MQSPLYNIFEKRLNMENSFTKTFNFSLVMHFRSVYLQPLYPTFIPFTTCAHTPLHPHTRLECSSLFALWTSHSSILIRLSSVSFFSPHPLSGYSFLHLWLKKMLCTHLFRVLSVFVLSSLLNLPLDMTHQVWVSLSTLNISPMYNM